jgi:hypothetical protein
MLAALDGSHGDSAATTPACGGRAMGSHRCASSTGESGAAATHTSTREEVAQLHRLAAVALSIGSTWQSFGMATKEVAQLFVAASSTAPAATLTS